MSRAALIEQLLRLLARLPLPLLHAGGALAGTLAALIPNNARHTARVNIELCFPDRSIAHKRALVRCSLRESAKALLELGPLWHRPPQRLLQLIRDVEGSEILDAAIASGRGVLIVAPHLGAWELLQVWVARRTSLHALYRPPRQPELEELINRARGRSGAHFWPARPAGVRALYRALRAGAAIGILPDQQPPGEGVFAPFFGVPAKTMTLLGKLAARSRAPIVIGWAERLAHGRGYRLHWRTVDEAVRDSDPLRAATAMNRAIEAAVRQQPCQYQWSYRRFSRRPEGEPNPYKLYCRQGGWVTPA
ncbi:lysophospholipid acyltransferase family protein [Nitrococcus mobilis]|uniref:Lipid A biosynthesis lauroyl acyltransferase n=1 Tax=Nitrococcus mobilis Nb-231 TaxID=314278 RepID=A4BVL1_9GAMM|nr:lysophospholipid acyltransferase family protein [Nitrococcus mobilis]EAR20229.1 lipid A biosynthesis lauroyl acyltransferase [Nitrococcus mobilis Nb-231]